MKRKFYYDLEGTRRDRLQIYSDVLMAASEVSRITQVMRYSNVQYNHCRKIIRSLIKANLLKEVGTPKINLEGEVYRKHLRYKRTGAGEKWCKQVADLYQVLEET